MADALPKVEDIPQAQPADVLLGWAKAVTYDYILTITNFSSSWQDGKVFAAILIESGNLSVNWESVTEMSVKDRLELVFSNANQNLDIPQILDIDDLIENPDAHSVQLYVSYLYKRLQNLIKTKETSDWETDWMTAIKAVVAFRTPNKRDISVQICEISKKSDCLKIELEGIQQYSAEISTRVIAQEKLNIVNDKAAEVHQLKLEVNDLKRNHSTDEVGDALYNVQHIRIVFIHSNIKLIGY